jgi:hypothetical protein
MHSFIAPSGRIYHHNGDFSGEVRADTEQFYTTTVEEIAIPFDDMVALVLQHLLARRITALENMTPDELAAELFR